MKKTIYWATILMALILVQCKTVDTIKNPVTDVSTLDPEIYNFLDGQGFNLLDAKQFDTHVLVEGDIFISIDQIRALIGECKKNTINARTNQFVANTGSVVAFSNVLNINFYIDNSITVIPGDWVSAILTGTQGWEDLPNCRVSFNEVATPTQAKIKFYADNSASLPVCFQNLNYLAVGGAEFPQSGQPGGFVSINDSDPSNTQANREWAIRNLLGITLGFRHDNPIANGEPVNSYGCGGVLGANQLVNTPTSDGSSVMVGITNFSDSHNFTSYDQKAAIDLYPAGYPVPVISSLTQYYKSPSTRDVKITMSAPTWYMYRYLAERCPPYSSTPVQQTEYTLASYNNTFWMYDVPLGQWRFRITSENYARDAIMQGIFYSVTIQ